MTADGTHTFTGIEATGAITIPGSISTSYVVSGASGQTLTITVAYGGLVEAPTDAKK